MVRAGKRTYFFDVKQAKTGEKYLVITESRLVGQGQDHKRSTIMVFADAIDNFTEKLTEITRLV